MTSRSQWIEQQARIFKALGHPSRLMMAEALTRGELCVCELRDLVGADISTVSRHLGVLRNAGIITDEKRGTNVYYRLAICCLDSFLSCTCEVLRKQAENDPCDRVGP